jgi:hypothetical protein
MSELTVREEKFYKKWEEKRKNKWLYVFLNGTVYWGLFMGITLFLVHNGFEIERMHLSELLERILIFGIAGIPYGLIQFNRSEKMFLNKDNAEIIAGIKKLKADKVWRYENLIITNLDKKTLVVRNKLFWFDKSDDLNEKLNECFDTIVNDYMRINKVAEFEKFSKNYNVRVQVFEVLDNEMPLIDRVIKS